MKLQHHGQCYSSAVEGRKFIMMINLFTTEQNNHNDSDIVAFITHTEQQRWHLGPQGSFRDICEVGFSSSERQSRSTRTDLRVTLSPSNTVMLSGRCPSSAPLTLDPADEVREEKTVNCLGIFSLAVLALSSFMCRSLNIHAHLYTYIDKCINV